MLILLILKLSLLKWNEISITKTFILLSLRQFLWNNWKLLLLKSILEPNYRRRNIEFVLVRRIFSGRPKPPIATAYLVLIKIMLRIIWIISTTHDASQTAIHFPLRPDKCWNFYFWIIQACRAFVIIIIFKVFLGHTLVEICHCIF